MFPPADKAAVTRTQFGSPHSEAGIYTALKPAGLKHYHRDRPKTGKLSTDACEQRWHRYKVALATLKQAVFHSAFAPFILMFRSSWSS